MRPGWAERDDAKQALAATGHLAVPEPGEVASIATPPSAANDWPARRARARLSGLDCDSAIRRQRLAGSPCQSPVKRPLDDEAGARSTTPRLGPVRSVAPRKARGAQRTIAA